MNTYINQRQLPAPINIGNHQNNKVLNTLKEKGDLLQPEPGKPVSWLQNSPGWYSLVSWFRNRHHPDDGNAIRQCAWSYKR